MKNYITSIRDLEQKLSLSLCRYKGEPVWVGNARSKTLPLYSFPSRKEIVAEISFNDEEFDTASPPLGYVNYKDIVYYITRAPIRRTRQGIDTRSITVHDLRNRTGIISSGQREAIFFSEPFKNMIKGKYPDLDKTLKELRDAWKKDYKVIKEKAVTRNIALSINEVGIISVYYKNSYIGYILPNDETTVIVPNREDAWLISRYLGHELSWKVD